jgi:hypothetical protein
MYLVINKGPYSDARPTSWVSEGPLVCMERDKVVMDIRSGQHEDVERVIMFDPEENTSADVTTEIAYSVAKYLELDRGRYWQELIDFLEDNGVDTSTLDLDEDMEVQS